MPRRVATTVTTTVTSQYIFSQILIPLLQLEGDRCVLQVIYSGRMFLGLSMDPSSSPTSTLTGILIRTMHRWRIELICWGLWLTGQDVAAICDLESVGCVAVTITVNLKLRKLPVAFDDETLRLWVRRTS